jgi:threonine dehydratase
MQYPVELIYTDTRQEAEERALYDQQEGFYYLHPSNIDESIAGAGTMCYEALKQVSDIDAIFASCGGGGLLSGSYLASKLLSPKTLIYGSEPSNANDAYLSIKSNEIYKFQSSPDTIADGLKALSISEKTYQYLKKLDDIILVDEEQINYWTKFCYESLNILVEPSCAINLEAANIWSKKQSMGKRVLILISGKNYDYI